MKCYYLKGKNGDYIARDPTTSTIHLTSSIDKALFAKSKNKAASIRLNSIPRSLKKFGPYEIVEIIKIDGKIYTPPSVESLSTENMVNSVIDSMDTFSRQMNKIEAYQSELNSIISQTDLELVDMLHYIEFHKFSACEGYKLCKKIQEICDRRRNAKNKLQIINTTKMQSYSSIISGSAADNIEKITKKQYTPRVLSTLFEDNQSKIRHNTQNKN